MKRASLEFHQSHAADEEARATLKHQNLLQEYLALQKEFVSKKKKLHAAKQKRETLLAEIGFLNRRCRYLSKIQSPKIELEKDLFRPPNSDTQRKMLGERNYTAYEAALENPYAVWDSNANSRGEEENEEQVDREALRVEKPHDNYLINYKRIGKKSKSYFIDDKRLGKKKISWQDQVTLKV